MEGDIDGDVENCADAEGLAVSTERDGELDARADCESEPLVEKHADCVVEREPVSLAEDDADAMREIETLLDGVCVAAAVSLGYMRHAPRAGLQ